MKKTAPKKSSTHVKKVTNSVRKSLTSKKKSGRKGKKATPLTVEISPQKKKAPPRQSPTERVMSRKSFMSPKATTPKVTTPKANKVDVSPKATKSPKK